MSAAARYMALKGGRRTVHVGERRLEMASTVGPAALVKRALGHRPQGEVGAPPQRTRRPAQSGPSKGGRELPTIIN